MVIMHSDLKVCNFLLFKFVDVHIFLNKWRILSTLASLNAYLYIEDAERTERNVTNNQQTNKNRTEYGGKNRFDRKWIAVWRWYRHCWLGVFKTCVRIFSSLEKLSTSRPPHLGINKRYANKTRIYKIKFQIQLSLVLNINTEWILEKCIYCPIKCLLFFCFILRCIFVHGFPTWRSIIESNLFGPVGAAKSLILLRFRLILLKLIIKIYYLKKIL